MMKLSDYTLHELFAMQDLMDHIDDMLSEYVTNDFKCMTGLKELEDRIMIEVDGRLEDEENEEK